MTPTPETIPARLLAWRTALHLTHEQAAQRLGIHWQTYRSWERNRRTPLGPGRSLIEREVGAWEQQQKPQ